MWMGETLREKLRVAVQNWQKTLKVGNTYTTQEIKNIGGNGDWIYPSDHCYNKTNKGNLSNAPADRHNFSTFDNIPLFECVAQGKFVYMGENYPYNGICVLADDSLYGEWKNGTFFLSTEQSVATDTAKKNGTPIKQPQEKSNQFNYEKDLRNFLAENLSQIEQGMQLYGMEHPAGGKKRIDILALDNNNDFVVIELKRSEGHTEVIGQISLYMAWVQENLATAEQKVRGIIICNQITENLRLACRGIQNIEPFEYEFTQSIKLK